MILEPECVHWWIIGNHSIGHCKKCGEIRDFEKLQKEEKARTDNRNSRNKPAENDLH